MKADAKLIKTGHYASPPEVRQKRDFVVVWSWTRKLGTGGVVARSVAKLAQLVQPVTAPDNWFKKAEQPEPPPKAKRRSKKVEPRPLRPGAKILPALAPSSPVEPPVPINHTLGQPKPPPKVEEPPKPKRVRITKPFTVSEKVLEVSKPFKVPEPEKVEMVGQGDNVTLKEAETISPEMVPEAEGLGAPKPPRSAADLWTIAAKVSAALRAGQALPDISYCTRPQKMLIAGRVANVDKHNARKYSRGVLEPGQYVSMMAVTEALGLTAQDGTTGKMFLSRATPEEVELAVGGKLSVYRNIKSKPEKPIGSREAYYQRLNVETQIWSTLKAALGALTALPSPDDVVRIARNRSATRTVVDSQILAAFGWLSEFADKWTKSESNPPNGHDAHSELGRDR